MLVQERPIHLFNKYLLRAFLSARHSSSLRDTAVNKTDKIPALEEL